MNSLDISQKSMVSSEMFTFGSNRDCLVQCRGTYHLSLRQCRFYIISKILCLSLVRTVSTYQCDYFDIRALCVTRECLFLYRIKHENN